MHRLYTDGSYAKESGFGTWAWVLVAEGSRLEVCGVAGATTHQRMELTAAVEGLRALPDGASVEVVSDSAYLVEAMARGIPRVWRRNGWRSLTHERDVVNRDLWEALLAECDRLRVRFRWVKAHAGEASDPGNVEADHLARRVRRACETVASEA